MFTFTFYTQLKMLEKLKEFLLNRSIKKLRAGQKFETKFHNLDSAKNALIVFDASTENDYKKITSFIRYIQEKGIKIRAVAYSDTKMVPHYCMQSMNYDFISKSDINFFYKPKGVSITNVLSEKFDILIDLNINNHKTLKFYSAIANAELKISVSSEEIELFDLIFQPKDKKDLNNILKDLIHYMENLGKKL